MRQKEEGKGRGGEAKTTPLFSKPNFVSCLDLVYDGYVGSFALLTGSQLIFFLVQFRGFGTPTVQGFNLLSPPISHPRF